MGKRTYSKNKNQTELFSPAMMSGDKSHKHIEEQAKRKKEKSGKDECGGIDIRYRDCPNCKYCDSCDGDSVRRNSVGQCLDYRHTLAPDVTR